MSETPKNWRMISQRTRFTGFRRETPDGKIEVSLTGNSWYRLNGNGHQEDEDPSKSEIIYQRVSLKE